MDAIMVLMQVGHKGDWTDRGLPEVVTGYDRAANATAAGIEWLYDHHPGALGDDWRLLVWADVRDQPFRRDRPTAVVDAAQYRAAIVDRGPAPSRTIRRRVLHSSLVHKIRAGAVELTDRILVTQRKANTSATRSPGPWFPASEDGKDAVAARVIGKAEMKWRGEDVVTLITTAGELRMLSARQPVIPVDEE